VEIVVEEIEQGKSFSMLLMCEDKQVGSMKELECGI
jgi:hypothetical protein